MGWQRFGLCAGRPDDYLTENLPPGDEEAAAVALCDGCPVFAQCEDLAALAFHMPTTTKSVATVNETGEPVMVRQLVEKGYTTYMSGVVMAGLAF